jgi:hypothetical protein
MLSADTPPHAGVIRIAEVKQPPSSTFELQKQRSQNNQKVLHGVGHHSGFNVFSCALDALK